MYQRINPTETFRERQLALLGEAEERRLGRRLHARRTPKARSARGVGALPLGFFLALFVVAGIMLVGFSSPAHADTTFSVSSTSDSADANLDDGIYAAMSLASAR